MPSAVVRRYAYRRELAALDVEFVSGRVYRYLGVPPDLAEEMRQWRAKGVFLNRTVRNRFAFEHLPEWPGPDDPPLA
ncbi:KTSC domain-containing protein [Tsuneonella sp. HG249]